MIRTLAVATLWVFALAGGAAILYGTAVLVTVWPHLIARLKREWRRRDGRSGSGRGDPR